MRKANASQVFNLPVVDAGHGYDLASVDEDHFDQVGRVLSRSGPMTIWCLLSMKVSQTQDLMKITIS